VLPQPALRPTLFDLLPEALCAAELGEPLEVARWPPGTLAQLPAALAALRDRVPHAALCLLERLATSERREHRVAAACSLSPFAHDAGARVEALLARLAEDAESPVRSACAAPLAALLRAAPDRGRLTLRWRRRSPPAQR
jgi:hypothetical protein